ncbi:MAG: hypothetical protein ACREO9_08615 [Lysobacterales bacterium]
MIACGLSLSACGWFGKEEKQPIYYSAVEVPPLEIPEGLDRPSAAYALVITTPISPLPQRELPAVPPRVTSQSGGKDVIPIRWASDGIFLFVADTPASTFRRLGLVIQRSGMILDEAVGVNGYRFEYFHDSTDPDQGFFSKLAFWRDDAPNYTGMYQAVIKADGENSRIYIVNGDGSDADPNGAEQILAILGERLG